MSLCKKHGKERDQIVNRGAFEYVGCVDCKNGVPSKLTPQTKAPAPVKGKVKALVPEPSPDPKFEPSPASNKPKKDTPPKVEEKKRGFFGFKL
jgi:hypothetical protein